MRVYKVAYRSLMLLFILLLVSCSGGEVSEEDINKEEQEVIKDEDHHESAPEEKDDLDLTKISDEELREIIPEPQLFTSKMVPSRVITTEIDISQTEKEIVQTLSEFNAIDTEEDAMLTLPDDILFEFGSDQLRKDADETIDQLVQIIETTDEDVTIVGHTDSRGEDDHNQKLSERRADAVLQALVDLGIEESRLKAEGKGASEPVARNMNSDGSDNPDGRQKNRRVEVTVHGFNQ